MNKKVLIILVIFVIAIVGGYFLLNKKDILSNIIETNSNNPYKKYTAIDTSLSKNTIAYIPLDDRPINLDRVKYLAESIDYNLVLPDINDYKTYLDNTGKNKYGTQFGNPQNLAKWLNNMEDEGCDYYIISLDQLFSGGLVGSRYLTDNDFESTGTDFNYVKKALERIVNDSNNHIYLFDTIMRLASTVSFYGLDLDTYNNLYNYGSISRKLLKDNELTVENIINNYKYDENGNIIGADFTYKGKNYSEKQEVIDKYLKARERKLRLYDYYFKILQGKNNVTLTVSVDDSNDAPNSIQKNETDYVKALADQTNREIYIRDQL